MARKGLLASVLTDSANEKPASGRAQYAQHGASRAMIKSLDELAENSMRLIDGEAIVELDPNLIDQSTVSDRISLDDEEYLELRDAIRSAGQSSPILVRPHPLVADRYMIVFGRRRLKAAAELGVLVRAIIKPMEEMAAIVAQGQENTARANLSFIEKALFAKRLSGVGHTKETIRAALTIDDTLLSRMLSVAEVVPPDVIDAIGPAKRIGRDRWEELKRFLLVPANLERARSMSRDGLLTSTSPEGRFDELLVALKKKPTHRSNGVGTRPSVWTATDNAIVAKAVVSPKAASLTFSAKTGPAFGQWIVENLDRLHHEFEQSAKSKKNGA